MVITFTKKALPDYSFSLFHDIRGILARKLTAATVANNTDSSKQSDIDIFQSLSERDEAYESGEESQLSLHGRAQVQRHADGHPIRPEFIFTRCQKTARVNMHESYHNRKQNQHNIWIFKIIH
ncbi:hypothetical protein AMECASPLE_022305 [Ameca splendens]|uniref:Uncharacterized protein n=1 Tax=Ameca splendens TaxID=208324 RepID=A0ABV0Z1U1_9TELE